MEIRVQTGPSPVRFCTVIHAAEGDVVLGASNEDWEDPLTRLWVIPGQNGSHGWIKFGFAGGFPQAGMNDAGLFWDATGSPYLAMPLSEANRTFYDGPLMVKVMEEAGSVEDAREIFEAYYCEDQYRAQYLVGDALGASMIVEGDSILTKEGRFQLLTNFYQSRPELGGYPCWRYEAATEMLGSAEAITPLLMGQLLDATHQKGKNPTQYSIIYDLRGRRVYLFHFHNFHEYVLIDLEEELQKGARYYDIPPLFSQLRLMSPADGASVAGSSAELRWSGELSSSYDICFSTSQDPGAECTRIQPKLAGRGVGGGVLLGTFSLLMVLLAIPARCLGRRYSAVFLALAFLAGNAACGSDPMGPQEDENDVVEMTHPVQGLQPGTTYYWKVLAEPVGDSGFSSESIVFSFTPISSMAPKTLDRKRSYLLVERLGEKRRVTVTDRQADLLQGTLDLLILKTLALGPHHGWGVSQRIQQMSKDVLQVNQGSLYPALAPLGTPGLDHGGVGNFGEQPEGQVLSPHQEGPGSTGG
jgi:choloylglycine hydrolase